MPNCAKGAPRVSERKTVAKFFLLPCVREELWEIEEFIAQDDSDAARRVIEAAGETFKALAETPGMGVARKFKNPRLRDVRFFPVSGFKNYLIFYRPTEDGILVLHIAHGARDLEALFDK